MARLTLTDAARVAGVSRVTLHRYIKAGQLRQLPNGKVDTTDLTLAGFVFHPATLRAAEATATYETPPDTDETPVTPVTRIPPIDYQERYIALLEQEVEELRKERDILRQEKAALQQETQHREQLLQKYQEELLQVLQQTQQRYDRLLDTPRS